MANATTVSKVQPLRFVDGDTVRSPEGISWRRGLRAPGVWEAFPFIPEAGALGDGQVRDALADRDGWLFTPVLPSMGAALPGTAYGVDEIRALVLRPATAAVMYAVRLDRVRAFLGNDQGVFREGLRPVSLRLADMRASLEGVRARRPAAGVTFHRLGGRAYVRYPVGAALHTHIYLLTR